MRGAKTTGGLPARPHLSERGKSQHARSRKATTAKSVATIAKVIGAINFDAEGRVNFLHSKKLPDLNGYAECSGKAVSVTFGDLTVGEAEAMLAVLLLMRKAKQ
jgi:hypothetical protein